MKYLIFVFLIYINVYGQNWITSKKYILKGEPYTNWWFDDGQIVFEKFGKDSVDVYIYKLGTYDPMQTPCGIQYSDKEGDFHKNSFSPNLYLNYAKFKTNKLHFPKDEIDKFTTFIRKSDTVFVQSVSNWGPCGAYFVVPKFFNFKKNRYSTSKTLTINGVCSNNDRPPNPKIVFEKFGKDNTMIYLTDYGDITFQDKPTIVYWFDTSIEKIGLVWSPTITQTGANQIILRIQDWTAFSKYLKNSKVLTIQLDEPIKGTFNFDFEINDDIRKKLKRYKLKSKITNCVCYPKEVEKIIK